MSLSRDEFDRLALEQLDMLYRIARRLTRNGAEAEDLVQETYVRALRARDSFELQQYGLRPWLLRIMHNLHITQRQRQRREAVPVDYDQYEPQAPPALPATVPPRASIDYQALDEHLAHALQQLPAEYQVVMLLWAVDELSYREIADALEIPMGTVMSRLHRARQRLAEALRVYASKEGIIRE